METVVTSSEMRAIDRFAIRSLKISSRILMEHAGYGVVRAMEQQFGSLRGKSVIVFCGKGNNGGDGYVAARALLNKGAKVKVLSFGKQAQMSKDAKGCFAILQHQKKLSKDSSRRSLAFITLSDLKNIEAPDFVIDAIFGVGLNNTIYGKYKKAIEWINCSKSIIVSIDIPSGVDADNGTVHGIAVTANLTVTFQYKKMGLIVGDGRSCAGLVHVGDISIPEIAKKVLSSKTTLLEAYDIKLALPKRVFNVHKYSVGKVLVIAGSRGLTGAAALAAQAAMKAGAGAVKLICPGSIAPVLSRKLTEVMVIPAEETTGGTLSSHSIIEIEPLLNWADVVAVGPGLSHNEETIALVRLLLEKCKGKLLLDADGINAFSGQINRLSRFKGSGLMVTPHTGELSRLMSITSEKIEKSRIDVARTVSEKTGCTIILKGAPTVIGAPSGKIYINSTGNPGMATAGAGDVLSGIAAGIWSQKMKDDEAAYTSVYLHGLAGDLARNKYGEKSLMALDILEQLPSAFLSVESEFIMKNMNS